MAEPIRHSDLVEPGNPFKEAIEGLQKLIDMYQQLADKSLKVVHDRSKQLLDVQKKANTATKEGKEVTLQATRELDQLNAEQKEAIRLSDESIRLKAKLSSLTGKQAQDNAKLKNEIQQQTKALKDKARWDKAEEGSLTRMRIKLTELKKAYADGSSTIRNQLRPQIQNLDRDVKKLESSIGQNQRKVGDYMVVLRNLAGAAGIGLGITGLISMTRELARNAVELDVLAQKSSTVFGDYLQDVKDIAEQTSISLGLTRNEFIASATAAGDLLVPIGFTRQESARLSTTLVNLSGALSEWTGGSISSTEVTTILTKALLGENEQLKRLGIAIRQDSVEFRTLLAQKKLDKSITDEQARALTTYELILAKSSDAQANFLKNSESLVRQQQELSAQWRELKELLATELIPVLNQVFTTWNNQIKIFKDDTIPTIDKINLGFSKLLKGLTAPLQANIWLLDKLGVNTEKLTPKFLSAKKQTDAFTESMNAESMEATKPGGIIQNLNDIGQAASTAAMELERAKYLVSQLAETQKLESQEQAYYDQILDNITRQQQSERELAEQRGKEGDEFTKGLEYQMQLKMEATDSSIENSQREQKELNKISLLNKLRAISETTIALLTGKAKTLAVGFPQNIPFLIGYLAQIAGIVSTIKSVKFAKGGHGQLEGKRHSEGGVKIPGIGEAERGEYFGIVSRPMTRRYRSDLPKIFDSLNQGKFHEVWTNANIQLQESIDPYTKKMYDLMMKTPTTYIDSNGDTVREYPDGNKVIIKR